MSVDQLWGTAVQEAIVESNRATAFGQRVPIGVAVNLPNGSPDVQKRAIEHLLHSVATLQTLVQLLADELDRRELSAFS
jgi:hypothetical protein